MVHPYSGILLSWEKKNEIMPFAAMWLDLEIIFNPLYILASFVKDMVSIGVWIYLWAFYFFPLIYVFVPVSYCPDDCGFVAEPEVRQVDFPVPFFLKIVLTVRGFLYFHTNYEIICSSPVKNTVGSLIGIALNL